MTTLFQIKPNDEGSVNLIFMKEVTKRSGEIVTEPSETLYNIPKKVAQSYIAHALTITEFGDKDVSLSQYLKKYNENYRKGFHN